MVSRGEIALILAALGLQQTLFPETYYVSIIFFTVLTPFLLPNHSNIPLKKRP